MISFAERVLSAPLGQTTLFFAGQAGFIVKLADGRLVGVDLYLSNCVERIYGYKRLMPYMLAADELSFDFVLVTHEHEDHFDVDSLPSLMACEKTKLLCARDAYKRAPSLGLPMERVVPMAKGDSFFEGGLAVHAVYADHGPETPLAVGYLVEADGKRLYFTGDTSLHLVEMTDACAGGPLDVLVGPINGRFGNMDGIELSKLASVLHPELTVPCHFWNFAEHGGDPDFFVEAMERNCPGMGYLMMRMGECISL